MTRNCFRCGDDFESGGGARICGACSQAAVDAKVPNPALSFREKQVVALIVQAKRNKEIATELHLTEGTIKEYLNRIYRKLGLSDRLGLAMWAVSQQPSPPRSSTGSIAPFPHYYGG